MVQQNINVKKMKILSRKKGIRGRRRMQEKLEKSSRFEQIGS